jgi:hypothetical protein
MAVYKIYPEKDATIYSAYPLLNTGLDQILEIQNTPSSSNDNPQVSRFLITFPISEIRDVINNEVTGAYKTYLKLFIANATSLPDNYTLDFYPVSQSWESGTGRFLYNPEDTNGVSWVQRNNNNKWLTSSYFTNTTGSFRPDSPGGGTWWDNYIGSQSFVIDSTKDVNVDVTSMITQFYTGSFPNNGIIAKMEDSYEFNPSSSYSLKFFSKDTHTIYVPQLEIKWNDSSYVTGGLSVLPNDNTVITLGNNIGQYNTNTTYRFRVNARPTYPVRQFVTQSVYTLNSALPSASYYAVQDLDTGEYIIDFDSNYTRVSCDSNGNYFDLYMAAFQPQRYYKILIKSSFSDSSTVVYDNDYIFKINK